MKKSKPLTHEFLIGCYGGPAAEMPPCRGALYPLGASHEVIAPSGRLARLYHYRCAGCGAVLFVRPGISVVTIASEACTFPRPRRPRP